MDASSGVGSSRENGGASSDFVKKLHKMLEDPTHRAAVRWTESGESFVVVDTNIFTDRILPQHFKHSNFASFVRQLNKYDFHKVKDAEGAGHGRQMWEFKHPDFTMHNKDNLENIKRKAPTSRKQTQQIEVDAFMTQVDDLQNQNRHLRDMSEKNAQKLHEAHITYDRAITDLQTQVFQLSQRLANNEAALRRFIDFIQNNPNRLPNDGNQSGHDGSQDGTENAHQDPPPPMEQLPPQGNPFPKQEPEEYRQYDNDYSQQLGPVDERVPENQMQLYGQSDIYNGSSAAGSSSTGPQQAQPRDYVAGGGGLQTPASARPPNNRKRSTPSEHNWLRSPMVLLVEDDVMCAKIGLKFLHNAGCNVDTAPDGLVAIDKLRKAGDHYDIVLMDIMMPRLDGCSAAGLIRQFNRATPIVAMTSNIRGEDINLYFENGMNDVLPKPFTKEGLLTMLERVLEHLKRSKSGPNSNIPPQLEFRPTNHLHPQHAQHPQRGSGSPGEHAGMYDQNGNGLNEAMQEGMAPEGWIIPSEYGGAGEEQGMMEQPQQGRRRPRDSEEMMEHGFAKRGRY